jgi:uncharacterized membrane protein YfcA
VRTALVLSTVLNIALLARTHRSVLRREGALLLVPAVASTPFLAWASRRIDGSVLTVTAGVLTVASAAALLSGLRWHRGTAAPAGIAAGVVSAAMNVVGSIGGPALALYTVNAGWPPERARPTLQVIFLMSNLVAMASLGLPHFDRSWWALLAALGAGWILGLRAAHSVPEHAARTATLGIAALGGVVAVARVVF